MSKFYFAIIFLISDVLCYLCHLTSKRKNIRFKKQISDVTGAGCITTTAYMFTLIFNSYEPMKIAYGIYFASMDLLCATLFIFLLTYSYHVKHVERIIYAMLPFLMVDSVSQLLNIFFDHVITFDINMIDGQMLFILQPKLPFQIHLFICYILVAAGVLSLIIRTITSSRLYRLRYLSILAMLIFIVGLNAVYLYDKFEIDYSILGYSICAILISFYTIFLLPKQLTNQMSARLVKNLNSAVVLFDDFGFMIYENELATRWKGRGKKTRDEIFQMLGIVSEDKMQEYRQEVTVKKDGEDKTLDVRYRLMEEYSVFEKTKCIGSYLVIDDITETRKELLAREKKAAYDELTGLYNQTYFCEKAKKLLSEYPKEPFAIAMTNINQFKLYNEVFGKEAGDQLLKGMANSFRNMVKNKKIVYGRYDADRFISCLPIRYCNEETVKQYHIDEPVHMDSFKVINYIGVCFVNEPEENVEVLCERAAIALNTIKGDASLRIAYFDDSMRDGLLRERELTAEFPEALKNNEIAIYVQPQINQITGSLVGGEVLGRWIRGDGKIISPGEFVPILEKNGMITDLDYSVWKQTCALIKKMIEEGMPTALSVNISAQDFYRLDLYETFTNLIKEYEIPARYLKLEITESDFLTDIDAQIRLVERLKRAGFVIEMDDFGSGYSSLNSLKDIPVDILKMDLHFLENSRHMERGRIIIRNSVQLAAQLNVTVITEGVETVEQAEFMESVGAKYIQGFLFGKPMPVAEFLELRRENQYEEM